MNFKYNMFRIDLILNNMNLELIPSPCHIKLGAEWFGKTVDRADERFRDLCRISSFTKRRLAAIILFTGRDHRI